MNARQVPSIFDPRRRTGRLDRARARAGRDGAAQFILDDMIDDTIERLAFLRHVPARGLVLGDIAGAVCARFADDGAGVVEAGDPDLEAPYPTAGHDLIAVFGLLDAVNDLPGALIHMHRALAPGGLVIAHFVGGQSLPHLRAAMLAAEPDRPAARLHPMVDPRAAPQLLQRAGWKDPVVDTHTLQVRYRSLDRLVADLRDMGLGNALARPAAPLGKSALARAREAFLEGADADSRVTESFEIVTLTGRRSLAGT